MRVLGFVPQPNLHEVLYLMHPTYLLYRRSSRLPKNGCKTLALNSSPNLSGIWKISGCAGTTNSWQEGAPSLRRWLTNWRISRKSGVA